MGMSAKNVVTLGCTMLKGTGKKGLLVPDADGYFEVPMGAYNAYNSAGMFYDLATAAPFFKKGSPLMRQLEKGVLRGEFKHPARQEGWDDNRYIQRLKDIDQDRHAFHIRELKLVPGYKDDQGRDIVMVVGKIRPSGVYGPILLDALNNPHENVYFSVRSLTADDVMRGIKYTRDIITWDFVNEGGIYTANKYNSPSLEDFAGVEVTPQSLWHLAEEQRQQKALGLETTNVDYDAMARDLGWDKPTQTRPQRMVTQDW